ncbi:MAG: hypothetical protein ABI275_02315, partial [Terrimesophilobacter sp.]
MSVWDELTGQADAIAIVRAAAQSALRLPASSAPAPGVPTPGASMPQGGVSEDSAMTHSWLITGPPGSGRSNLAYAFATALLSPGTDEGDELTGRQVEA